MNLRDQLKSTNMSKGESIQYYFTRVSQFREKLSVIGDTLNEDEIVMTSLNGLTRYWESFIQTMCARKESMKFDIVWEYCIQEEDRIANREVSSTRYAGKLLPTYRAYEIYCQPEKVFYFKG